MKLYRHFTDRSNAPLWLIIFSDMSTNLMMFFLMLFAMTRMDATDRQMLIEGMEQAMDNKPAIKERARRQKAQRIAIRQLNDTVNFGLLKEYAKIEVTEKDIKITLDIPYFFRSGSAIISNDAHEALGSLVLPLTKFETPIIIEGHTDDVPIKGGRYPSNWELSVARAVSVIEFFTLKGFDPKQLVAGGYGEYHPAFANDTPEHRAQNRRIEITVVRQDGVI